METSKQNIAAIIQATQCKEEYIAPYIEIIDIKVEQGYAASNLSGFPDKEAW